MFCFLGFSLQVFQMDMAYYLVKSTTSRTFIWISKGPLSSYFFPRIQTNATNLENAVVKLWAYFPEGRNNITSVNVSESQPIVVHLPQSIVIAKFDTPVYATYYTLRVSKNIAYRFEGKCNTRTMSV